MERGVGFLWNTFGASSLLVSASRNKSPYSNAPWRRHDIKGEIGEIRVCTNRTCRRQGSLQTLETLSGLAPPNVTVKSCGCLGRCGAGPNLAALRDDGGGVILVGHCGTAARSAEIMMGLFCGHDSDDTAAKTSLEALALRKRAETESEEGNFSQAELLLSRAIELKPFGGIHILYKNRSLMRLALGNCLGALEDAREALKFAPKYHEAYICQGDAFLAMDQFDSAEKSYLTSLQIDPSIRCSKSFKASTTRIMA
ncbi:Hsp70-Hsp90 organizing protein 3 [Morella rubra]|uniref:Hsp70-Hsp90 organizing protein 3 n=1 Tax=Morella rubra TaxID=262757 RepID=A0A6A1VMK9_9ROSI|nr:Hsp70-Hsp90 organizing protein 3 [Morella rubra]